MQHESIKRFSHTGGLDLKSSNLDRKPNFCSAMLNAQYTDEGAFEKRRGHQCHSSPANGFGVFKYNRADEDGIIEEIVLAVGRGLKRLYFTTLTVAYAGAEASGYLSLTFNPTDDKYRCVIFAGITQVLDMDLGVGIDEGAPVTISDLAAAINGLAGFTATVTGDSTVPAAFLKSIRDYDTKANDWAGKAGYWSDVNSPITNPFDGSYTRRNQTDFENVSAANLSNLIFFANGFDEVLKYDGQTLYRAGVPIPASLASVIGAAGAITGSNYFHRAQYVQVDAVGNITEGNIQTVSAGLAPVAQKMDLTVANIQASTGFNTNAAIVAGAQVTVNTITVDDGSGGQNTMKVGDTAYFFDSVTGDYVEREVTARNSTTITVDGAAVTVADNAVISNNLRIMIQRNKTSAITPTVFYEVVQLPNNPFTATQVYVDNTLDSALGAIIDPPATDRSPPPKGKYLVVHQELLFILNLASDSRKLHWSDVDGPEYFPSDTNQKSVEAGKGEEISGAGSEGSFLYVFTEKSTFLGAGTFGDNNCRLDIRAASIGCSGHSSIERIEGFLVWLSHNGPYKASGGQIPTAIGEYIDADGKATGDSRISPVFKQRGFEFNASMEEQFFRLKRAVAVNWTEENKLLFFVPCESLSGSDRYVNSNSRVFAYDYARDAWLEWSNMDMIGGACEYADEFYFIGRRLNASSAVASNLMRVHNLNDAIDYQDNLAAIRLEYAPQWEFLGEPGVMKKFLELLVYSLEEVQNNTFNVTVQQEINFLANSPKAEFDIELTGSGYGQSAYGSEPYGDQSEPKFKHELAKVRTYATRTKFVNEEAQTNCVISGWEILYAAPFRKEFKK